MHLVRGETMVYNYVNILLDAMYTVEDDLKVKSRNQAEIGEIGEGHRLLV